MGGGGTFAAFSSTR
ncbi:MULTISPECIES: hypothetical protein [unclassified Streptomyces]|uniref:Uncharacterized protein n=1 Tax=Streptomyces sp. R08 TaxID=3238624 RepID=A0AB39MP86_9ACTN